MLRLKTRSVSYIKFGSAMIELYSGGERPFITLFVMGTMNLLSSF